MMKVKLRGSLDQTASWAEILSDGSLAIELYDFSADARKWLGHDVAYTVVIPAEARVEMLSRLSDGRTSPSRVSERDRLLLHLIQQRFADYFAAKHWLDEQAIPYRAEFEPWA
jgi:hypothetical protein